MIWLAVKTRAEIATAVSVGSSMQTKDQQKALNYLEGIWKYLAMTWNEVTVIQSDTTTTTEWRLEITTDASHAPGGDRSRSGVVILLGGVVLHWHSGKQGLTAMSTCESEIEAAHVGMKIGMAIKALVEGAIRGKVKTVLIGNNQAAIRKL